MGREADIRNVDCPGCGRTVAAVASTCLYCRSDLSLVRRPSGAPDDEGDATRCALCNGFYLRSKYPGGCPDCARAFADPHKQAEVVDRRRGWLIRHGIRVAVAALIMLAGLGASGVAQRLLPTFGSFDTPAIAVGGALAALFAWRSYDDAKLSSGHPMVDAAVVLACVWAALAPWCIAATIWANGFGLDEPPLTVRCVVESADDTRHELSCQLDDGTPLHGVVWVDATGTAAGRRLDQPMRRGRLGAFVSAPELVAASE